MGCCGDNGGPAREEERHLTDVVWLVAFFLFLVLMASISPSSVWCVGRTG